MIKPNLVAFVGPIGSGKTACAEYFCKKYGYTNIKFAGPLKRMLKEMGLTDEHLEGALKEQPCDILAGRTPRWARRNAITTNAASRDRRSTLSKRSGESEEDGRDDRAPVRDGPSLDRNRRTP